MIRGSINFIEKNLGKSANITFKEVQQGDVEQTYADISKARKLLGYEPKVKIEDGIKLLCEWYLKNRAGNN